MSREMWDRYERAETFKLIQRQFREPQTATRKPLSEHPGADATHHDSARANTKDQSVKGEGPGAL